MVRLHALDRMNEHAPTPEVKGVFLGLDGALDCATGPEGVVHRAPRVLSIRAKVTRSVLTDDETRSGPGEGQVHHAVFAHG